MATKKHTDTLSLKCSPQIFQTLVQLNSHNSSCETREYRFHLQVKTPEIHRNAESADSSVVDNDESSWTGIMDRYHAMTSNHNEQSRSFGDVLDCLNR